MKKLFVHTFTVILPALLCPVALAAEAACHLEFAYELRSEAGDDSVSILFTVEGRNLTAAPIEMCGKFVFDCFFRPDPESPAREQRCPTFIVVDEDASPTLNCDPIKVAPGEAVVDTLGFTLSLIHI